MKISSLLPSAPGDQKHWGSLSGCALSATLLKQLAEQPTTCLVITASSAEAQQLEQECRLLAANPDWPIMHFPDWEILPYDTFSPHQDILSERLQCLYQLPRMQQGIVVVSAATALHRLCPREFINQHSLVLNTGDRLDIDQFRLELERAAYRCCETVYEHGEFAIRGSIIDIFPMGSDQPLRIELFDDEIESLRTFDAETQRSIDKIESIKLLPGKEHPLDQTGIARFAENFKQRFDVNHRQCSIYQDITSELSAPGIEYFLPLFFEHTDTLFDYLPNNTVLVTTDGVSDAIEHFWQDISSRHEELRHDVQRPILNPGEVILREDEFFASLKALARIHATGNAFDEEQTANPASGYFNLPYESPPELPINARASNPYSALQDFIEKKTAAGYQLVFCAESAGRRETLLETLQKAGYQPALVDHWQDSLGHSEPVSLVVAPLERGLIDQDNHIILVAESQLYGQRVMQRRRRNREQEASSDAIIKNLTELKPGSPVVHIDAGVGRYRGLQTLTVDDQPQEFLLLEYADEAKLYVPVSSLHLISRYSGADEALAPLHKLGSEQWQKQKKKAAEQIHDVAAELLNIHARRAARQGHEFPFSANDYELFASGFPFEETPDQQAAIEATLADMRSPKPMDRLVCGDVGFGKTEVAMRAAFVAVQGGKQVSVLVPTTLLAQQHYESFRDRFADWPVQIEVLSRFKSAREQQAAIDKIRAGKIDIVIGTHKLLQPDIQFKNLGLLIVDEEHRFGVRHKEALKNLRANVDMLTLTATPIPRTLNMAMGGLRDLSIIATPPAKRLSIKTFVKQSSEPLLKEAILRELLRGGQVYFLHNEVKTIEKTARKIEALIPEARVGIAHGQMRERELEQVMSDFYHRRFNVLVCTTIIETGIDIPSANTIIIERADKFGLAQLHQLRGRVGRSHHQAYAYLLTPHPKAMTRDALKRLEAIEMAQDLGAGFMLASHDLEIRGAGELLGEEQSGNIQQIGFSLYMEMLERAVDAIKTGKEPNLDAPLQSGTEINLHAPALIPDDYIGDVDQRLILYKRIANTRNPDALTELRVEIVDRFGPLPEAVKNLLKLTALRIEADTLGIRRIDCPNGTGKLEFSADTRINPLNLVKMVQNQPQRYRLQGADTLKFMHDSETLDQKLEVIRQVFHELQAND